MNVESALDYRSEMTAWASKFLSIRCNSFAMSVNGECPLSLLGTIFGVPHSEELCLKVQNADWWSILSILSTRFALHSNLVHSLYCLGVKRHNFQCGDQCTGRDWRKKWPFSHLEIMSMAVSCPWSLKMSHFGQGQNFPCCYCLPCSWRVFFLLKVQSQAQGAKAFSLPSLWDLHAFQFHMIYVLP